MQPNYKNIFTDIIHSKFPNKISEYSTLLEKSKLSSIDIMELNEKIFGNKQKKFEHNHKYKSYSKNDIQKILDYQRKEQLNNSDLAKYFKLSRNTISKWKKHFL